MALRGRNRQRQSAGLATTNAAPIITPPVPSPFRRSTMAPQMTQPYDDAIMRENSYLQPSMVGGLLPDEQAANPMGMQDETSLLPQSNGFGGLLGNSFTDPQTFGVLGGAAAMLERAGPQVSKPVSTGQVIGAGLTGFLDQFNARDRAEKLDKAGKKGFISRGPVVRKGTNEYIGEGVFNPETGQMMLSQPDGTLIPMPADAEPTVKSFLSRDATGASGMIKLEQSVAEHEKSLGQLQDYLGGFENRNTGYKLLADKFTTSLKTFFDKGDLSPNEFAQAYQNGQLQGLLGAQRLSVVGGGVMTEQDALRVIAALGGDISALQNPEIVAAQIERIYNERYQLYETDIDILNRQRSIYGQQPRTVKGNPFTPLSSEDDDVISQADNIVGG